MRCVPAIEFTTKSETIPTLAQLANPTPLSPSLHTHPKYNCCAEAASTMIIGVSINSTINYK